MSDAEGKGLLSEEKLREMVRVALFLTFMKTAVEIVSKAFDDMCSSNREICEHIEKTCSALRSMGSCGEVCADEG